MKDGCHENVLTDIDVNQFRKFQIATTASEPFLKFWDIRNHQSPNFIFQDPNSFISACSYNPSYDQLMLYGTVDGSLKLLLANSGTSFLLSFYLNYIIVIIQLINMKVY